MCIVEIVTAEVSPLDQKPVEKSGRANLRELVWPERGCLWIHGDPRKPGARFCGKPLAHKSYCDEHADRAYVKRRKPADPFGPLLDGPTGRGLFPQ